MAYAERTQVPVQQSRAEIEKLVQKRGGEAFGTFSDQDRLSLFFRVHERNIRFTLPLAWDAPEALKRQRFRALLLVIKAKFESIDAAIESVDEAFMNNVVMPDGQTVGEHVRPNIVAALSDGRAIPLLPKL